MIDPGTAETVAAPTPSPRQYRAVWTERGNVSIVSVRFGNAVLGTVALAKTVDGNGWKFFSNTTRIMNSRVLHPSPLAAIMSLRLLKPQEVKEDLARMDAAACEKMNETTIPAVWTFKRLAGGDIEAHDGFRVRAVISTNKRAEKPYLVRRVSFSRVGEPSIGGGDNFATLAQAKRFCDSNPNLWGR